MDEGVSAFYVKGPNPRKHCHMNLEYGMTFGGMINVP
jgi:hypothetical protein